MQAIEILLQPLLAYLKLNLLVVAHNHFPNGHLWMDFDEIKTILVCRKSPIRQPNILNILLKVGNCLLWHEECFEQCNFS